MSKQNKTKQGNTPMIKFIFRKWANTVIETLYLTEYGIVKMEDVIDYVPAEWYVTAVRLTEGAPFLGIGPAVICTDGTTDWVQHGKLHRDGCTGLEDVLTLIN